MDTKPKSVGTFFKPVVIDPRLRELVNTILLAPTPSDPRVLIAKKRIRAMTKPATSYLFATEIQSYLDSKTLGSTETWVFPLVGDLFMDALEVNLSSLGPNFFRDHYSGIAWCYGLGRCPRKSIQGAFYCIDLALRKTLELFLAKDTGEKAPKGVRLSFQSEGDLDYHSMITVFLDMARQYLRDVIEVSTRADNPQLGSVFMEFVIGHKTRLEMVLSQWEAYHRRHDLPSVPNEQYLDGVAGIAEKTEHAPLAAMAKEYHALCHEHQGTLKNGKTALEQEVHPLFGAASLYLAQGAVEREAEAYDLALRRFGRAIALFSRIHDRTSTAKAHVERARVFIKSNDDPEALRDSLHTAIGLIMAHIKDLPQGEIPEVAHETAIEFLKNKGYLAEAEAYASSLRAMPSHPQ